MSTQSQNPLDVGASLRPIVGFAEDHLRVTPGETERLTLVVRNGSSIVETYDIIVLGPTASWVQPSVEQVSLFPGEEGSVDIVVSPPRVSQVVAGTYVLGVQVMSRVARRNASTAETLIDVLPFYDFQVITGRNTFNIRTRAKFMVQVTNHGNATTSFRVSASDPEGYLKPIPADPELDLLPGERKWTSVRVKAAPRIFGNAFDTRNFTIFVVPIRDTESQTPLVDIAADEQRGTVLHKPFIRVRLGLLGRLALIIGLLALVAAFVVSRLSFNSPAPAIGAPPVPGSFSAEAKGADQVVLTWDPSSGATGYKIYSIDQGKLYPSATSEGPSTPTSGVGEPGVVLLGTGPAEPSPMFRFAGGDSGGSGDGSGGDSGNGTNQGSGGSSAGTSGDDPAGSVPSDLRADLGFPTPVCADCSLVTDADAGTTLFTVEKVAAGLQCYRITALGTASRSLYSAAACTTVVAATGVDVDGDGVVDGTDTDGDGTIDASAKAPPPCRPIDLQAQPVSDTTVVILWKAATQTPSGWLTPAQVAEATGPVNLAKVCDPTATLTGFGLQRKILTGWSDVNPGPTADDTAFEVGELAAGIEYCFRMRSVTAESKSRFTKPFCAQTLPAAEPTPAPSPSGTSSPEPSPSPTTGAIEPGDAQPEPSPMSEPRLADLPN